jgi:hypothetical protein
MEINKTKGSINFEEIRTFAFIHSGTNLMSALESLYP